MTRVVLVGEGMVEFSRGEAGDWRISHGGDTLNTALHLTRYGADVGFLTALGDDPFSQDMRAGWIADGLDERLLLRDPNFNTGLYAIQTDAEGERTFFYWRADSAARRMFELPESAAAMASAAAADVLVFSLITLAILPPTGRAALLDLAAAMGRAGKTIAFDGNYRARLWPTVDEARHWRDRAIACTTIGLPTLEDEAAMGEEASADAIARRWLAGGAKEVVVKLGADGCQLPDGRRIAPPARLVPRDTSGAGDAFDAGYLQARIAGLPCDAAALAGHRLAGWVVMRAGAVPPRDDGAPYTV